MKEKTSQKPQAFLVEKEDRVCTNPNFVPVCVILAADSSKAREVAERQLGIRWDHRYRCLRKGNEPYNYRISEIELVEDDDPWGINEMIDDGKMQFRARR